MSGEPTPSFAAELTEHQRDLLRQMAERIVQLRMTTPAILFLESVRPLNYVGSQVMVFFAPLVRGFFGMPEWDEIRLVLERRESIGYFVDLIEEREAAWEVEEKKRKEEERAARQADKATRPRPWWRFWK